VTRGFVTRRQGLWVTALAIAGVITTPVVDAHRSHVTLTRVSLNPRSGLVEIVHAIHYHDALRLLAVLGLRDDIQPSSIEGRARVALEVEKTFRWSTADGAVISPVTVGAELEGDNLLVYQEMSVPATSRRLIVESSFMQNVFADQVNRLLVEYASPAKALQLSRSKRRVEFDGPSSTKSGG
jgi:hypothetical protein